MDFGPYVIIFINVCVLLQPLLGYAVKGFCALLDNALYYNRYHGNAVKGSV
jgi:hypothetical protein